MCYMFLGKGLLAPSVITNNEIAAVLKDMLGRLSGLSQQVALLLSELHRGEDVSALLQPSLKRCLVLLQLLDDQVESIVLQCGSLDH